MNLFAKVYKDHEINFIYRIYVHHVICGYFVWNNLSKKVMYEPDYVRRVKRSPASFEVDRDYALNYLKETKALRCFIKYIFEGEEK